MRTDNLGQIIIDETDIIDLIMRDPDRSIKTTLVEQGINISNTLDIEDYPKFKHYVPEDITQEQFDKQNQESWLMPPQYYELDIAQLVLNLCKTEAELQRAGNELIMFQERGMFPLLQYLKYLVDTMQQNNIVWGVGRGSSVASYVLYLLGVHKIDSMYYDLDIHEFLKPLKNSE